MSTPYLGEIRMFAGNFAPRNWALCDGQLLPISTYDALFSLLGTTYGGDGETTFALPELRGRVPVHSGAGAGPGLAPRPLGQRAGTQTEALGVAHLPSHSHTLHAVSAAADTNSPAGASFAVASDDIYATSGSSPSMGPLVGDSPGGGQAHTNLAPALCVNFIIALTGVYPSES